jgi:peroxiredoxin
LAEYRDQDFAAAGADIAALSVDDPARAAAMRDTLKLPFPVLCDSNRDVVTAWGLLNRHEKGGIAYPAVFVLDRDRTVRYRSLDRTASRVSTDAVMEFLRSGMQGSPEPPKRRTIWPGLSTFVAAVRSALRHGTRVPGGKT